LYSQISKTIPMDLGMIFGTSNREYPQESYDSFVRKMIEIKKEIISKIVEKNRLF
jgi:hypothetical protein